jgi:hypothetical protein
MIRKTAALDHLQTARIDATPNTHQDIDDKYQSETIVEVDVCTDVPIDQVSQSMRHVSTVTTERKYCRARAESAFAHIKVAHNRIFLREQATSAEND